MSWIRRAYPFNAEQTVNILSEFGPLVTMFVVNAAAGIDAGTWALLISTVLAMVVMRLVLGRLPIFPIIASSVTVVFGVMTLITGDAMWVQIKVSIFNAMFAGFLFGGLCSTSPRVGRWSLGTVAGLVALGVALQAPLVMAATNSGHWPRVGDHHNPLLTNMICLGALALGFVMGLPFRRNFFSYVFEETFHYTKEGWDKFTFSFAWFFVFTAVLNEVVRQVFHGHEMYNLLGYSMNGVNVWILFKIAFIMPLSGLYAWYLTRVMQKYRLEGPEEVAADAAQASGFAAGEAKPVARPG